MDNGEKSSTILPKSKGKICISIHKKNVIENKDNDVYVIDMVIIEDALIFCMEKNMLIVFLRSCVLMYWILKQFKFLLN